MSEIIDQFRDAKPKLERLRQNIESVIKQIIGERNIPVFGIESRIKNEESFVGKVARKSYSAPLDEIDDLCGVRVICYYQEDIENICDIVESEFEVLQKDNKKDALNDNQFGYTSYHYIVRLKNEWLAHPGARGLGGFRAEIQIRTMLMHTWAAISHKLLYKREADVPPQFKRQLNRLSALIELADEQFDAIKNVKVKLVEKLTENKLNLEDFSELSSDSLVAIYNRYFSDRAHDDNHIPSLLEEIREAGFNFKDLVEKIELCLPILTNFEKEEVEYETGVGGERELPKWHFSGAVRTILDLTSDKYFESRAETFPPEIVAITEKYRRLIR